MKLGVRQPRQGTGGSRSSRSVWRGWTGGRDGGLGTWRRAQAAGGADRIGSWSVDTGTTGVYPTDRVVEIALVTLSLEGDVVDVWETLIQPQRDVGASFIHGTPGLKVVFTGDRSDHPRDDLVAHARRLGLVVLGGVTKTTDVLVAADPESNSGKAAKARRYGIPVVSAVDFAHTGPGGVLQGTGSSVAELKVITCPSCLTTWTAPATSSQQRSRHCPECSATS